MNATQSHTLAGYLAGLGVKINVREDINDKACGWQVNANHYRITLTFQGRKMALWYYQGKGIDSNPSADDVIYNLASDRFYSQYTLQEFGDNLGWDIDTISNYRAVSNLNKRYERLIGSDEILNKIAELAGQM